MKRLLLVMVGAVVLAVPGVALGDPVCPPTEGAETGGWSAVSGAPYPFEVWYQQTFGREEYLAQDMAQELKSTIWPKEVAVMGRLPVRDPRPGTGGNLQICLDQSLDDGNLGLTVPIDLLNPSPTYVLLALNEDGGARSEVQMRDALAHEFFHVLEQAFPHDGGRAAGWWREASANWAMDLTYPHDQGEQPYAHYYFDLFDDLPGPSIDVTTGRPSYGAYVFPFFLAHVLNNATIGEIWQLVGTGEGVPEAISDALGSGGLRRLWPQFMAYNWNGLPLVKYRTWDDLTAGVALHSTPDQIPINQVRSLSDLQLPHLSARFYDERIPDGARALTFVNTDPYGSGPGDPYANPDAQVQAIVSDPQTGELQSNQMLTGKAGMADCFALTGKKIQRLQLIFTDSSPTLDFSSDGVVYGGPASVIVSNDGCSKWAGSFTAERDFKDGAVEKTSGTITFEMSDPNAPPDQPYSYYVPTSGTVNWSLSDPHCTYTPNKMTYPATESGVDLSMGWSGQAARPNQYTIAPTLQPGRPVTLTRTCNGTSQKVTWYQAFPLLTSTGSAPLKTVDGGGLLLDGKNSWSPPAWTDHWSWSFTSPD